MMSSICEMKTRRPKSFIAAFAAAVAMIAVALLQLVLLAYFPSRTLQLLYLAILLPMMAFFFLCNVIYVVQARRGAHRDMRVAPWKKQPW